MATLIEGGTVVTAEGTTDADVLINDEGVIAEVGPDLGTNVATVIDARGRYVLPGAIDPHTHIETEAGGRVTCDDFTTGTAAAACGGTTTIIHFCFQRRGESFTALIERWRQRLTETRPIVDVGFHVGIVDVSSPDWREELEQLASQGVTSAKMFMAVPDFMVDDATLFAVMQAAAESGVLVMTHAENGPVISALVGQAVARGDTSLPWHSRTRPPETEAEATNRAVQIAHIAGCSLYVVHVSCEDAIAPIRVARGKDWKVWGETCPQYGVFDDTVLEGPPEQAGKYVYIPPPRPAGSPDKVWAALAEGALSVIGSDHCPYTWAGDRALKASNFTQIPPGAPGVEQRLQIAHHFGVNAGHLTLERMVDVVATTPAKLFGMYPRKGAIRTGSDADIVVFDPERRVTLTAASHHSAVDYNLYEGIEVIGAPDVVLVRGHAVVAGGELIGQPGDGRYVARARHGEDLPAAVLGHAV